MAADNSGIGVLLLAAGASRRLGYPKQLLRKNNQTLLEHMAQTALDSGCRPVVVTLGAYADQIRPVLQHLPLQVLVNTDWESGMGSSVAQGIRFLEENHPDLEAVILMLCDQPLVQPATLQQLADTWQSSGQGIVAAAYGGTFGPPAIFARRFFPELSALQGEKGAKASMLAHPEALVLLDFPEGMFDLDTVEGCGALGWGTATDMF